MSALESKPTDLTVFPLGFIWPTVDPFLFCVHHDDAYPAGTPDMAVPPAQRTGRNLGMDFEVKDGFRMYHGQSVPGFPSHPHRGFETVTLARRGLIDHSDSMGATARFGGGDVQWMTAGGGVVHAEMFPLVKDQAPNPAELFQIWLNLPARDKHVAAHFTMLWAETIPQVVLHDRQERPAKVTVIAGAFGGHTPPKPPPDSWASKSQAEVAIWNVKLAAGAELTLPAASPGVVRSLYLFEGSEITIGGSKLKAGFGARFDGGAEQFVVNGAKDAEFLVLQGRPIGEPVAQHGPFVMNTQAEIRQAFADYQRTGFGGWPWPSQAPVHAREKGRFAIHADGRQEQPPKV
jgi:redox-sensitive bicupin YhaK (pirin superfamily)